MISFLIEQNEAVRKFFEGSDDYIPVSEYKYLHERPLLRPNFITEIDVLVQRAGEKIVKYKVGDIYVPTFTRLAITIGQNLEGDLTDHKVKNILLALRETYKLANEIDKRLK